MPRSIRVAVTHLRAQWMGALALFFVIAGGTAYAANTVFSSDIVNGEVKSADIATEAVRHAEVADGVLNDEDVGEMTLVGLPISIGTVNAHACKDIIIGIAASEDHLLLTADHEDAAPALTYRADFTDVGGPVLHTCNPTDGNIDDGFTHFNLLIFDAH